MVSADCVLEQSQFIQDYPKYQQADPAFIRIDNVLNILKATLLLA